MPETCQPATDLAELFSSDGGGVLPAYHSRLYGGPARLCGWCLTSDHSWLPAASETIAAFVDDQVERHCLSTIKRRLCAIAFAHRICRVASAHRAPSLASRCVELARRRPSRPKQVRGLTHEIQAKIVAACPVTLAGLRDAALISVGYDTLCRSSELSAMQLEHVGFERDCRTSSFRARSPIRRRGSTSHISRRTRLRCW